MANKIKIHFTNGNTLTLAISSEQFMNLITNQMGVVINNFVNIGELKINPSHVSIIEPLDE